MKSKATEQLSEISELSTKDLVQRAKKFSKQFELARVKEELLAED